MKTYENVEIQKCRNASQDSNKLRMMVHWNGLKRKLNYLINQQNSKF